MSEFPNREVHRGDGVSIGGIAIAVVVLLAIVVVLSMLSAGTGAREAGGTGAIPTETAPAAPAPTE